MIIDKFKLKHLDEISKKEIDHARLMSELIGYEDTWYNRLYHFIKSYRKIQALMQYLNNLDLRKIELNPNIKIIKPDHIDNITFAAMMKIQMLMANPGDRSVPDLMCELIALACYSSNASHDFDTDTLSYKSFKHRVWNTSAIDMAGLYNWISGELTESKNIWQKRFFSVQVDDKDYEQAGGNRMDQFNVITTIKHLCNDFNVTEEQAWQLSYALSQTNSYAKATYGHIQDGMAKIKERRMKQQKRS